MCIVCKKKQPYFNYPGERDALFCGDDKLVGMIDIKNKKCIVCKKKQPSYGFPGKSIEYCFSHKLEGCVKDPVKKCENQDCKEIAIYGGTDRERCEEHRTQDDILLTERKCTECGRIDILTRQDLCVNICNNDEIYKHLKKMVKKKEIYIEKLLQSKIDKKFDFRDIAIDLDCSKKRPDFGYDVGTHVVFIEVDENQHKSYPCQLEGAEDRRMWGLFQSLGGKGVIFIRYNPDAFRDSVGKIVKVSQGKREEILLKWIEHSFNSIPEKCEDMVRVKYLFFNGWMEEDTEYVRLTEKDAI
jgi:hypothetical protein